MNVGRRSLLKMLGMAPMAAPLAAKVATDSQIAKLAGVALEGTPAAQGPYVFSANEYAERQITASNYAKLMGIPDFVKEALRRETQHVYALDPDLAAKRSWSMSVKIATQRERNYNRRIAALEYAVWSARSHLAFKKLTGWDWPF